MHSLLQDKDIAKILPMFAIDLFLAAPSISYLCFLLETDSHSETGLISQFYCLALSHKIYRIQKMHKYSNKASNCPGESTMQSTMLILTTHLQFCHFHSKRGNMVHNKLSLED